VSPPHHIHSRSSHHKTERVVWHGELEARAKLSQPYCTPTAGTFFST
jgi:hypothetical protein